MRSSVTGLATVVLSLLSWGSAQAAPLDGVSATWSHSESGTGGASKTATVGGYHAYLSVSASAYPTQYGDGGSAQSTLDLVFQIDTPTAYSLTFGGMAPPPNGGSSYFGAIILNEELGIMEYANFDKSGILQPGSYHTSLGAYAYCPGYGGYPYASCSLDLMLLPEPATLGLLALGAAGLVRRNRRKP